MLGDAARGFLDDAAPVAHLRGLAALEEQMCRMTVQGYAGKGSPDRVDALVWALTELIVDPSQAFVAPRLRTLG